MKRAILLPCSPIFSLAFCSSHFPILSEGGLSNCTNGPKSTGGDGDATGGGEALALGCGGTAASGDGDVCASGRGRPFASRPRRTWAFPSSHRRPAIFAIG